MLTLHFAREVQTLSALQEAAYRVIGTASCQIDVQGECFVCILEPNPQKRIDLQELRRHFLDLVTDENLRAKIAAETSGVRDVILALAFGALARSDEHSSSRSSDQAR